MASLALESTSLVRLTMRFNALPLKFKVIDKQHKRIEAAKGTVRQMPWQIAVNALSALLAESNTRFERSGLPLSIVLSNQFVRYKVIPALPPFTPPDKALLIATHCFREAYGDIVEDWTIKLNPVADGDTLVACAIDSSLMAALQGLAQQYHCTLKSVQPYLMSGFNMARRHINPSSTCFAQVEDGRITIALIQDGAWQTIAGCGAGRDWEQALTALIAREILLADWPQQQLNICLTTPDTLQDRQVTKALVENTGWKITLSEPRMLPGYIIATDQPFSMALSLVS